jgi:ribosomal protein S18 acetylase RimI-like enzyme
MEAEIAMRPLQPEEARQFATLQRLIFAYYNSSKLGLAFCTRLYTAYASRPEAIAIGAWRGQTLAGLLTACQRDVEAAIQRELLKPAIRAAMLRPHLLLTPVTLERMTRFLPLRRSPRAPELLPNEAPVDPACIKIVTIGVAPEARRLGLAARMTHAVMDEAVRRGFRYIETFVYADNQPKRKLCEKLGFVAGAEPPSGRGSVRYSMSLPGASSAGGSR